MDYIFFAFSALCVGFAILLGLLLATRGERQLLLRHILVAGAVSAGFYYLEITVFHKDLTLYYLFNLLPQTILLILIAIYLFKKNRNP